MHAPRLLTAVLFVGLVAPTGGCQGDREKKVRAPEAGVLLRPALKTGTSLDGHIQVGTTRAVEGLKDSLTQSIECDARLLVMATDAHGSSTVRASFRNVELDWSVPPEVGLSSEEFRKLAATELRSIELRFVLSARGGVLQLPTGPERPPPELTGLLDTLALAVTTGFVALPARRLQPGDTWIDQPADEGRRSGVPRIEARFEGIVRKGKGSPNLVRISQRFRSAREVDTPGGPRRRQLEGITELRLNEAGVPVRIETELRDFDPLRGLAVQELRTRWSQTALGSDTATDVQDIDDPCDPDYVGRGRCAAQPGPAPVPTASESPSSPNSAAPTKSPSSPNSAAPTKSPSPPNSAAPTKSPSPPNSAEPTKSPSSPNSTAPTKSPSPPNSAAPTEPPAPTGSEAGDATSEKRPAADPKR